MSYLTESLAKKDILDLIEALKNFYGERFQLDTERIQGWKNAKKLTEPAKQRILKELFNKYPVETLVFIFRRFRDKAREVLSFLLLNLRKSILTANEEDAQKLIQLAEILLAETSLPLSNYVSHEVKDLTEAIDTRRVKPTK